MRYLALYVESAQPLRFRLVREAYQDERTDYPKQVVLNLDIDVYVPVVTVRPGPYGLLVTETHGIEVEIPSSFN
jgi:hypothetical protein